ncbi:ferredoxin reductase [Rhodococcus sp. NPDC003318]|uniref:ferredoxin reductase n=1 Tax=Rhodococcus sp. NPDC003318 TaxID=3364503 RepID=UPI0036CA75EA
MFTEIASREHAVPTRTPSRLLSLFEAMATPHPLDRYLELVDPMATVRDLRAEVVEVRRPTPGSVTLTLRPTRQWDGFRCGQFVRIGVVIDGVRHARCFSPAGSEHGAGIELTVKAHGGGLVSGYLYRHARVGLVVGLSQADGTFVLPRPRPSKVLLISGGSGITPVISMLRTLVDEGHRGDVTLLHYADRADAVPYLRELRALSDGRSNVNVVLAYTHSRGGDLAGRFCAEHLRAAAPWFAQAQTYLCGPPALMRSVRELFDERNLGDRLHTEEFSPVLAPTDADADGSVTFAASDVTARNVGTSLLEQAENSGLTPEYGCRMGICFTCTTVKTSGCTRNLRTGELDHDPDKPIQLCVNAAVGDVTLDL